MNTNELDFDEEMEEGSFLKRNWLALVVGALVLAGGTTAAIALSSKGGAGTRKAQEVMMVQLPPPPVALPPPPPPPPVEQEMIDHEDEAPKEAPVDTAPSTGVVSSGPADNFGLRAKGGNGRRNSAAVSTVSTWAPYASQAASRIADAMRNHSKLKSAAMGIKVRVWIDATGRITKAAAQSTGDSAIDAALKGDVLTGMQLSGPPPQGMVMPVNLWVSARRP